MADDYAYPPSIRSKTKNYFSLTTYEKDINGEYTSTIRTIDIPQGSDAHVVIEGRKIVFSERGQYTDPRIFDIDE
jgi:hypothetical protein